jgi:hypothetical protein
LYASHKLPRLCGGEMGCSMMPDDVTAHCLYVRRHLYPRKKDLSITVTVTENLLQQHKKINVLNVACNEFIHACFIYKHQQLLVHNNMHIYAPITGAPPSCCPRVTCHANASLHSPHQPPRVEQRRHFSVYSETRARTAASLRCLSVTVTGTVTVTVTVTEYLF